MILQSGREIPDDAYASILDEIIETIIIQYASFSFEDFGDSIYITTVSLQEDPGWLPDNQNLTYEEATELVNIAKAPAREFANELSLAYCQLCMKYIGTMYWATQHEEKVPSTPSGNNKVHLTPRELEVLQLLAAGKSNEEIAAMLAIRGQTAKNHVWGVMKKMNAKNRTQAVVSAIKMGLVKS